jgi:hypothetical protein
MNAAANPGSQANRKRNTAGGAQATPEEAAAFGAARSLRNQA